MAEQPSPASAIGSPVVVAIRSQVPEFDAAFSLALNAEGEQMGAFQAMRVFAQWVGDQMEHSSESPDVRRAFTAIEEIAASSKYLLGRALVTEFVEALADNPQAVLFMGPETRRFTA